MSKGEVIMSDCDKIANLEKVIAKKASEIARLRELVKGLLLSSSTDCADCRYDCGQNRENCIIHEAAEYIEKGDCDWEENAKLRAMVRELSDILHDLCCCEDCTVFDMCDITDICPSAVECALVARAREMIWGGK